MPIDTQDGSVSRLPSVEENKDPRSIRRLLGIGKVASFTVPHAGNKLAMSASSNTLEASIVAFSAAKEGDVASSPSPVVKNKRSANRHLFAVGKLLPFASPSAFIMLQ